MQKMIKSLIFKRSYAHCIYLILASQVSVFGQELTNIEFGQTEEIINEKRHFISINPIKPFIGLPNLHYEYQLRRKIGITAFSEVLAYTVIPEFQHPDAVNTIGFSFYPFLDNQIINQGVFININSSYVVYFRDNSNSNSFANGVQIGYKWLFNNSVFLEPKIVLNYIYQGKMILPGFEILLGMNF